MRQVASILGVCNMNRIIMSLGLASLLLSMPLLTCAQDAQTTDKAAHKADKKKEAQKPDAAAAPASDRENADQLRKAAQNPVASLISVPVQENWNFNIGPYDRTQNVLNVQPVIPVSAGKDWNLIIRWIMPIIYQPVGVVQPPPETGTGTGDIAYAASQQAGSSTLQSGIYGFGDMQPAFFFSPKVSKVIWGVGPQLLLPTATKTGILGLGKFGIGPTAVVLVQPGKWTLGFLVNNVWGVAGHSNLPDVNQFLLQYFINYNLPKGWYITWQPTITANWEMTNGGRWVVPLGGGIGRIMKLGPQPVNVGLQFYGNAVHPPEGSPWTLRVSIAFLYPKKPKS
jgi:hypothetical protein